jgi:ATP-dependent Clp protease ATP-binding subunit ClpA
MGVTKQAAQKRFVPKKSAEPEPFEGGVWARFTKSARHVVVRAQEEARTAGHDHVGTEHLLLGLLYEPDAPAARAIEAQGVSLDLVRTSVTAVLGPPAEEEVSGHIPFTPRAKKVRELTVREALRLGHGHIGTEHILLGLLEEEEGPAARVLAELGVSKAETETRIAAG